MALTDSKKGTDSAKVANGTAKNTVSVVADWKEDATSVEAANGAKGGISAEGEVVNDRSSTVSLEEGVGSVEVANAGSKNAISEERTTLTESKEGADLAKVANGVAKNSISVIVDWKEDDASTEAANGSKCGVSNAVSEEGTALADSKEGADLAKVANGMAKNAASVVIDWKEDAASAEAANGAKDCVSAEGRTAAVLYHQGFIALVMTLSSATNTRCSEFYILFLPPLPRQHPPSSPRLLRSHSMPLTTLADTVAVSHHFSFGRDTTLSTIGHSAEAASSFQSRETAFLTMSLATLVDSAPSLLFVSVVPSSETTFLGQTLATSTEPTLYSNDTVLVRSVTTSPSVEITPLAPLTVSAEAASSF
ncbi:hypothetical protein TorRG33x02_098790 [Trema orientale]|uniref:Uncharacterized protein n=1 Tax=Trema orientale TaxID=63057 RepID=A0A2P5F9D3_TREOI|nr:hypothetical protein TorRG33x02_098790 [Trema orientale]